MTLSPGDLLNHRYQIQSLLGQGGFGAVYLAIDRNIDAPVAIKESLEIAPGGQKQFQTEARLLYRLRHANLPVVHDMFSIPGQGLYMVMDYIEGQDLGSISRAHGAALPAASVLDWIDQVCDALVYLHSQVPPVIHRDIKPANIRIAPDGRAFLVDFGISKLYEPAITTTTGARAVTPGYSPPEQYGIAPTDERSDIYSLGATLYTLLTGHSPPSVMDLISGAAAPLMSVHQVNPEIPLHVSLAIQKAMQSNRAQRWASVAEFRQALVNPGWITSDQGGHPTAEGAYRPGTTQVVQAMWENSPARFAMTEAGAFSEEVEDKTRPQPRLLIPGVIGAILALAALFILFTLQPGSATATPTAHLQLSPIAALPSITPAPEITPTKSPSPLPSPTFIPTWTPTRVPLLDLPYPQGKPLPVPPQPFSIDNPYGAVELARWGKGAAQAMAWSPDGRWIAIASSVGLFLYDAASLDEKNAIADDRSVIGVAFSPDSRYLVASFPDKHKLQILTVPDLSVHAEWETLRNGYTPEVIAFSPEGSLLAFPVANDVIQVRNFEDLSLKYEFEESTESNHSINSMTFTTDGRYLVNSSTDNHVRLRRASDGKLASETTELISNPVDFSISPNGGRLAVVSGSQIGLLLLPSLRLDDVIDGDAGLLNDLAYSPDGSTLAAAGVDNVIRLFEARGGSLKRVLRGALAPITQLEFSPDGEEIAGISDDGQLRVWQVDDGRLRGLATGYIGPACCVVVSPQGEQVAVGSVGNTLNIFRLSDGELLYQVNDHSDDKNNPSYSDFDGFNDDTLAVQYSPDGSRLATASKDGYVRLWDARSAIMMRVFGPRVDGGVDELAFFPDNKKLAAAGADNIIRIWDVGSGALLQTFEGHSSWIDSLAISPDGALLVSGGADGTRVWDALSGDLLRALDPAEDALFSFDGKQLVTTSSGMIRFWKVADWSLEGQSEESDLDVPCAFATDGRLLVCTSYRTALFFIDAERRLKLENFIDASHTWINGLAFSVDGRYLFITSRDGVIRVWGIP